MNRAIGFSWVAKACAVRYDTRGARSATRHITTGNANGTARIYIRQANRSNRQSGKR